MTKVQTYTGEYLEQTLEDLLQEITSSIKSKLPDSKIILFGSYARGDYTKDSDLDICVLVPRLTNRRIEMELDALEMLRKDFPLDVELVLYTFDEFEEDRQNRYLLQYNIYREGVMLGEKQQVS